MLEEHVFVHTVDHNKRCWPRDTAWQRRMSRMFCRSKIRWGGKTFAYIHDSLEGMDCGPSTLIVDLTRPEVLESPGHLNPKGEVEKPRHAVPKPCNSLLHSQVCLQFSNIYAYLDGTQAVFTEMAMPLCDSGFGGRYVKTVHFHGRNGGKKCFDYDRGWIRQIQYDSRPLWKKDLPLAMGQIVFTPRLWVQGPAYINLSSWTCELSYHFHQICTEVLSNRIYALLLSPAPCYLQVFFRPDYAPTDASGIVAIAECRLP